MTLLLLRISGSLKLAFADDCPFLGGDLVATLDLDLFLLALFDLGDAHDMLVVADSEDRDALRVASHDANVADRGADHLALVGDQHQLLALMSGEGGDDAAVTLRRVDVGNSLAAAIGAAILIGRGTLAVAVLRNRQDELLAFG